MAALTATSRGTVPFDGHETWFRVTGELGGPEPAVVVVHGGPGSTHDYLAELARLNVTGLPVVHYDQLGNGGSTHLPDAAPGYWSPELFAAELDNLLRRLRIGSYVLFGQSWGGMLAAWHAAGRPEGLRGLVIANSPASYPLWRSEMVRLRAMLPAAIDDELRRHEAAGTTDSDAYHEAMRVFYDRHVCRLDPWPRDYQASFYEIYNDPTVYYTMNGPSEFHVIGSLKDWSVVDVLDRITVPTLVLSGEHDEATPATVRPFVDRIPNATWTVVEGASHLPHLERPEAFMRAVIPFLLPFAGR